jgi:Leucine-rich repeat (LRR) protein
MMPILAKFENLETLSLNGNRLQSLPNDMTGLEKLIELDISNNLFKDVQDVIPALKTLPRLAHLMYSLKNDEEETLLKR